MLYLGLGFLVVAVVALVLGFAAGVPGLGPLASVALLMAFIVSVCRQGRAPRPPLPPEIGARADDLMNAFADPVARRSAS